MRLRSFFLASSLVVGCSANLPEGRFVCTTDDDCPDRWSCWSDNLCRSDSDPDSGVDAFVPCVPSGAADEPDAMRSDVDCDGIDGAIADSVFVDGSAGSDANAGTQAAPVATIAKGLEIAVAENKHAVLLGNATYSAQVVLVAGIGIHGGYVPSNAWSRTAITATQQTIVSAPSSPVVVGTSITVATRLTGVQIQAPNATSAGTSSIAMKLVDVDGNLSIENATIRSGTGAQGSAGAMSAVAPVAGNQGANGNNAATSVAFVGGSIIDTVAPCACGQGGWGQFGYRSDTAVRNGPPGRYVNSSGMCVDAVQGGSAPSDGAIAGSTNSTVTGRNGAQGANGPAGSAGQFAGALVEAGFSPLVGGTGGDGAPGGGGGGGASGLVFYCAANNSDLVSASAGAGGSGGCGGGGGTGGSGGGASIGLHLWRSTPTLIGVALVTADGGMGGAGGPGRGGAGGGMGGAPGLNTTSTCQGTPAHTASAGGMGGTGGQGGQGGGGAGGPSIAILLGTDSSLAEGSSLNTATIANGGTGGAGGNAGVTGASCASYAVAGAVCEPSL